METSKVIFVDSNYFIGLSNPDDLLYARARKIAQSIQDDILVLSNFVFGEVVTVVSQRRSREAGIEAGQYILSHPRIRFVHIDENLQKESWRIFQEIQSKNISFVDCSIIAAMNAEDISTLLTFDRSDFAALQKQYRFSLYKDLV